MRRNSLAATNNKSLTSLTLTSGFSVRVCWFGWGALRTWPKLVLSNLTLCFVHPLFCNNFPLLLYLSRDYVFYPLFIACSYLLLFCLMKCLFGFSKLFRQKSLFDCLFAHAFWQCCRRREIESFVSWMQKRWSLVESWDVWFMMVEESIESKKPILANCETVRSHVRHEN